MTRSTIGVLELAFAGPLKLVEANGQEEQELPTVLEVIGRAGVSFNPATQRILCQPGSGYIFPCG
ncbi:MAG: hypothetical protein COY66_06240, partial [Candidatus Kerfeldbacteria bacterium CG_4_10_14_0_8_um_filter_42_10]